MRGVASQHDDGILSLSFSGSRFFNPGYVLQQHEYYTCSRTFLGGGHADHKIIAMNVFTYSFIPYPPTQVKDFQKSRKAVFNGKKKSTKAGKLKEDFKKNDAGHLVSVKMSETGRVLGVVRAVWFGL